MYPTPSVRSWRAASGRALGHLVAVGVDGAGRRAGRPQHLPCERHLEDERLDVERAQLARGRVALVHPGEPAGQPIERSAEARRVPVARLSGVLSFFIFTSPESEPACP